MKDSIQYLKDDVADIMRLHYDRIQDVHAKTRRALEALVTKAYFDGIDEGVEKMMRRLKKGEAA
tara:strand:- start:184 stop:375 length:192 start_codon:yes stop_codon:yes gene_type:complete